MYSKCINELLRFYFVEESIRVPPEQVKDKLQLSGTLFWYLVSFDNNSSRGYSGNTSNCLPSAEKYAP